MILAPVSSLTDLMLALDTDQEFVVLGLGLNFGAHACQLLLSGKRLKLTLGLFNIFLGATDSHHVGAGLGLWELNVDAAAVVHDGLDDFASGPDDGVVDVGGILTSMLTTLAFSCWIFCTSSRAFSTS